MKKSILFLASLAGLSIASAQSSVTMFGTIDVGIARLDGTNSSRTGVSTGGANISRLGFRGTEDLGGGLAAGFWLEAGVNVDDGNGRGTGGTLSFNRRSTVSLLSPWGEVRLGRDDSATFLNTLVFDPFLTNGVGGTMAFVMNGAPIQVSNAVSYFLPPSLGGFYGQVQYVFGEQISTAANTRTGNYGGGRFGYQNGGLNAAVSLGNLKGATNNDDVRIRNAGISYDFGVAKPMLLWASEKRGQVEIRALELGVVVPVGAGQIRAQVSRYDTVNSNADWTKLAIGYGYNLSKRTQVYGTYARINNGAGAQRSIGVQGLAAPGTTLGGRSNGYEVGMRHFF